VTAKTCHEFLRLSLFSLRQIIENEIREVRTNINNHLDKLQEDLMKELTEEENLKTEETRELMASLDKTQQVIVDVCPDFPYFILNYYFLFPNCI
jgi:hypothetical protein